MLKCTFRKVFQKFRKNDPLHANMKNLSQMSTVSSNNSSRSYSIPFDKQLEY
jgi:hypothetical protein